MGGVADGSAPEDLWHLTIDDLLVGPGESAPAEGSGPFVITLSASNSPPSLPPKGLLNFEHLHLYQVQHRENGQLRFRLRLGPITTDLEADVVLASVREHYPRAWMAPADEDDMRSLAVVSARSSKPLSPAALVVPRAQRLEPVLLTDRVSTGAPPARKAMPAAAAPREQPAVTAPAPAPPVVAAASPKPAPPATAVPTAKVEPPKSEPAASAAISLRDLAAAVLAPSPPAEKAKVPVARAPAPAPAAPVAPSPAKADPVSVSALAVPQLAMLRALATIRPSTKTPAASIASAPPTPVVVIPPSAAASTEPAALRAPSTPVPAARVADPVRPPAAAVPASKSVERRAAAAEPRTPASAAVSPAPKDIAAERPGDAVPAVPSTIEFEVGLWSADDSDGAESSPADSAALVTGPSIEFEAGLWSAEDEDDVDDRSLDASSAQTGPSIEFEHGLWSAEPADVNASPTQASTAPSAAADEDVWIEWSPQSESPQKAPSAEPIKSKAPAPLSPAPAKAPQTPAPLPSVAKTAAPPPSKPAALPAREPAVRAPPPAKAPVAPMKATPPPFTKAAPPAPKAAPAFAKGPAPVAKAPTPSAVPQPDPPAPPAIDQTRTLRALTPLELAEDSGSRLFVIQLLLSESEFEADAIPNLGIFDEYRLYAAMGLDGERVMHALRLGFFTDEGAAAAVAGYLKTHFESAAVKRVSEAERERFADRRVAASKDAGATGVHAAIELSSPDLKPTTRLAELSKRSRAQG